MRGAKEQGRNRPSYSQTHESINSWGQIRSRRRHHFTSQRHKCSYFAATDEKDYSKDVKHYGDAPVGINTNKTLRILGGNIHGVNPAGLPAKIATVAKRLKLLQIGHVALQETNAEWNKAELRELHTSYYKREFGTANFQYGTTIDEFDSYYKPGGTASGALGPWVHRVVGRGRDETGCGRWTYVTYGGKNQKRLTIISVYRVSGDPRVGSTTARKQQHAVMYKDKELRPFLIDPSKQTLIDLQYLVDNLTNKGHEILISIDANQLQHENNAAQKHTQIGKTKQGFHYDGRINGSLSEFIKQTGLINLTTHKHEGNPPKTYVKGKGQIDYLLGSFAVAECTEATGILNESTLNSDHCALYIDLNIQDILGIDEDEAALTEFTNLRLDDPRVSTEYRKELHKQFTHHDIYKRVKTLQDNSGKASWDLVDEMLFEQADKSIGEAMTKAARSCTKRTRKEAWTKSISEATHAVRYWSARIARQGVRDKEDPVLDYYRNNAGKHIGSDDITLQTDVCIKRGIGARHRLKDALKESKNKSATYEEEVAAATVERNHPHLTADNDEHAHEREDRIIAEIKNMGNRKSRQGTFKKLARQIKEKVKPNSTTKSSLNHILIPNDGPTDTWDRVTGKENIEQHLRERNVKQFSAAGATPFGYSELGQALGHTGDSPLADDIHDGTANHPAFEDSAIRAIVDQLKAHPTIKKILKPIVTLEDFKEAVRLVPEKTASSYSGRGVPHYKACAEKTKDPLADVLATVHAAMMSIPLTTGYCPTRWKHVIDVMLAKIPGIARTDKLRIIQLLEADLNQVLRIAFARNIARLSKENADIISEHQYGKSDSACSTPIINKLLTIQLLIQKKTAGIIFDNDAKGCYDLIISGISLATLRRIGFSKNSVKLLGTLWAQLQHHIATGYGVSETTYSSTAEKLLYGIGQGSCASPILWALLNQLLMAALGDKFECIVLHSVDKTRDNKRPGDSFVDDTTSGVTNDDCNMEPISVKILNLTETEENMVSLMQEIMQFFLDILQVTGGDLSVAKCVWFLLCFRWRNGKARLLKINEGHRGIELTAKTTKQTSGIKRKGPTESHVTLGFHIMGNGKCDAQREHMKTKASKYGKAIAGSRMWKNEAWTAYNVLYLPSVGYGTAATTLSMEECEDIQRPVVNAILPKMGIARSAPRAAIFGTEQYGGMGLTHLAALQGHSRLQYFIGHLRAGDTTGGLIRTMIEYVKLECGCKGNPLMKDYNTHGIGIINKNWITDIWKHLTETGAQLDIPELWEPTKGREGDKEIMEFAYKCKEMTRNEKTEANRCRIYMRAYFTSDISTLDGTAISHAATKGQRQINSTTSWAWPVQQRPTTWAAWRKLLKLIATEGRLDEPLGIIYKEGHRKYEKFYNDNTKVLTIKREGKWTEHKRVGARLNFEIEGTDVCIPRDYTHVVQTTRRRKYFEIISDIRITDHAPAGQGINVTATTRDTTQLSQDMTRLMGKIETHKQTKGDVILATDGSVVLGTGYHGWIIANEDGEMCAEGGGPDDGDLLLMTSFRSELGGVAGGLAAIGTMARQGQDILKVKLICDNQSAIKRCNRGKTTSIYTMTEGDYDLTASIDWLIQVWCKGITVEFVWVKGHADDLDRNTTLEEELNIKADLQCDTIRKNATGHTKAKTRCNTWSTETCSLIIQGTKITSHWKERLTQQLLDGKLRAYLMTKENWTENEFEDICWPEQERATKRISKTRRAAVAKLCHNLCYTGIRGNKWFGEDHKCKLCNAPNEDWRHVTTCKSISAELMRADSWNKVKKTMEKWKMTTDMWITIESGIRQYCKHPEHRRCQTYEYTRPFKDTNNVARQGLRKTFKRQTAIGWENFIKGRISKAWTETMNAHYKNNNIKLSSTEWTTKMVLAMWDHSQRIWKFRNDTVHKNSSKTTKQYKIDEVNRQSRTIQEKLTHVQPRMTSEQAAHFDIDIDKLQFESKRCWNNIAELYLKEIEERCDENLALNAHLQARGGIG